MERDELQTKQGWTLNQSNERLQGVRFFTQVFKDRVAESYRAKWVGLELVVTA